MAAPELAPDSDLARVEWNLDPLLNGRGDGAAGVDALLDDALGRADAAGVGRRERVGELDGPGLVTAMTELAELQDVIGRAAGIASRPASWGSTGWRTTTAWPP